MIQMILPFVKDMEIKAIVPYNEFLSSQKIFVKNKYKRLFGSQGYESSGMKLLRYILQFIDMDYMDSQVNNYDRYTYHVRIIRRDLIYIFDRVRRGRGYYNLFFDKNRFLTEEFLLPVLDTNSLIHLPLYSNDWDVWRKVRPLRLWSHDSDEFTVNIINDRIKFKGAPPSYAVELLDVVALVFKYYIWFKFKKDLEPEQELVKHIPQQYFLHKYVLCDLVWDLSNIWLLSNLNKLTKIKSINDLDYFDSSNMQVESQYGWISMKARRGYETLWKLLNDTRGNVRPESLLSSKILYGGSLNKRIRIIDESLDLPILAQYDYLRWLRDKQVLNLFIDIWKSREELPTTRKILVNVDRDFKRLLRTRPWNNCQNVILKNQIEEEMTDFAYLLR